MDELALFTQALALTDPAERSAFLGRACAADPELRRRLDELLTAHARSGNPLDRSPVASAEPGATADLPAEAATAEFASSGATSTFNDAPANHVRSHSRFLGAVIAGRYTLTELIGEGGMGSVYRAEQTEPVKRAVALKLIKSGMDSKAVLARFDAERQALALMDHPNIARVFDGGRTDAGQPFFVMELVRGVPLTDYCDQKRLSVKARLELFVQVCQAVQHAHQKGIIHRDLKPGNVLVTEVDGRGTPKVIDFGVAKATELKLTDLSFADTGAIVGTPAYMSPEQADPSSMDIDTRTDVYALGVILYEMLTGSPPIDSKQFKRGAVLEMLRMVREVEPPRPSTKLSTAEALPNIAANRSIEPGKLAKLLQGELDWVVMKAIEKDRTRRYDTANGLARDIQRYLADEVVEARPPSHGYRLKKFVKRNKGQVIAACLVLSALLAGIAGTTLGLIEARQQEQAARSQEQEARRQQQIARDETAEKEKARLAAVAAREKEAEERGYAEGINRFVTDDFLALTSVEGQDRFGGEGKEALSRDTTLRELLDRAAQKLRARKDLDPRIEAELCWIIGVNYRGAGETKKGIEFLERAVQLRSKLLGRDHESTSYAMNSLALAYLLAGENDKARPLFKEALEIQKARLGPDDIATLTTMGNLAEAYQQAGKWDVALPLFEETRRLHKLKVGPEHPHALATASHLAAAYQEAGKLDLALPLLEETLKLQTARLGPDHRDTLDTVFFLAEAHLVSGKGELALPLFEDAFKLVKRKFGPEYPQSLACMAGLAMAYSHAGQNDKALPLFEESLKLHKARFGPEHPNTLHAMNDLAGSYQTAGKKGLALPLFEEAFRLHKARLGPEHPNTLKVMGNLAEAYQDVGKRDLALPLFEQTFALKKARLGPDHPSTLRTMGYLARAYQRAGKLELALPLFEQTLKLGKGKLGLDHPDTLRAMNHLAEAFREAGKLNLALPLFEETRKLQNARLGPDHPDSLATLSGLAFAYWLANRLDKSTPLFEELLKLAEKKHGRDHPKTQLTVQNLGMNYAKAGRLKDAIPLLEEAVKFHKSRPEQPDTLEIMHHLAELYLKVRRRDRAIPLFEDSLTLAKARLGPEHPNTLGLMNDLAALYWQEKRLDKSVPLFEEALRLGEKRLGRDHPETLRTLINLGVNYKDAGRLREAIPLLEEGYRASKKHPALSWAGRPLQEAYTKAGENAKLADLLLEQLPGVRRALPKNSPELAGLLAQIGLGLLEQKRWVEAEPLLRECLGIREKAQPDAWSTFNTQSMLGGALLGGKNYAEAEPLLLKGYQGMKAREKTIPPPARTARFPEALDRLVELYTATDKPTEAAKWRAERARYPDLAPPPREKRGH